jgi:putative exosortase-associated protein (TIGR04073 family)
MDRTIKGLFMAVLILVLALSGSCAAYAQWQTLVGPWDHLGDAGRPTSTTFLRSVNLEPQSQVQDELYPTKLGAGMTNIYTCWMELPAQVGRVSEERTPVEGLTIGVGQGVLYGMMRGAAGTYDAMTCMLPEEKEPLMEPAYQIKNPDKEGFKINIFSW